MRQLERLNAFWHRAAVVILVCLCAHLAWGDGRISGTAKDPTGAVIPQVSVTAICTETQVRQSTITDAEGFYAFPSLPIGHYDVQAKAPGFTEYRVNGLTLDVNSALQVDLPLQLGQQTQQVSVSAAALQVETTNTQMGEVITGSSITAVPLNGRTYLNLMSLQPGVAPSAGSAGGGLDSTSGFSVSGSRENADGFNVNGSSVKNGMTSGATVVPNLDSIAEFRIITNNFDAEYGNYSGGQVNTVTKSGTNQFHGNAFDFLRNTDLTARNFYSPTVAKFIQNQFGGTGGGPIVKNKLFIFGDYQGTRTIQGQNTGIVTVPSVNDRNGNISDLSSLLTGTVTGPYWAQQLSQKLGYGVTPGERYYMPGCTVNSTCVFPNGIVPQSVITEPSQKMLSYIPPPNSGLNTYTSAALNAQSWDDLGGLRIDQVTNKFGMISWYYFIDNKSSNTPATFPGFSTGSQGRVQLLNIGDTKTFGANKVNEFRVSYNRYDTVGVSGGGTGTSLSSLGFVTGTAGINALVPSTVGVPPTTIANFTFGVSASAWAANYAGLYQAADNFSWVRGTHTFKFGGTTHYDQYINHGYDCQNGCFNFQNGNETGSGFVDYLIGAPTTFTQGDQLPVYSRLHYAGIYAQDSWRVAPTVTVNYGLRWDITQPWYETNNQLETIIPGEQSQVFPGAPKGWVFPGDPGVPSSMGYTRYHDFAPRLGVAWAPSIDSGFLGKLLGGPGKTSIRAGAGIFYTAYDDNTTTNASGDAPYGFFWVSPNPPLFTQPYIDRATGFNEGQRFPPQVPPSNASPKNPDNNIDWASFEPLASSPGFWHENVTPYVEEWNLSIQRQFTKDTMASISYVGSEGHHLIANLEANPGNPALCLSLSLKSEVAPGSPTCGPNGESTTYTAANGTVYQGTRGPLGPAFTSDGLYMTMANSAYHALEATFRHRSGPLELLLGFTWSKSLDDSSGWQLEINPLNYGLSRNLSTFDVPYNFVASYSYELPFAHLFGQNRWARGWILAGITHFANGLPVTLSDTGDRSLLGTANDGAGSAVDRPNCAAGLPLMLGASNPRTGLPYFNTAIFSRENIGQFGTCDTRFFHGPGLNNFDLALLRDTHITESKVLEMRFEFFNAFNHAQFSAPSGSVTSQTFGVVTSARSARVGQVALKFLF